MSIAASLANHCPRSQGCSVYTEEEGLQEAREDHTVQMTLCSNPSFSHKCYFPSSWFSFFLFKCSNSFISVSASLLLLFLSPPFSHSALSPPTCIQKALSLPYQDTFGCRIIAVESPCESGMFCRSLIWASP